MAFPGRGDTDSSIPLRTLLRRTGSILLGVVIAFMVIPVLFVMSDGALGEAHQVRDPLLWHG
jgi:hypothetical protein